MIVCLGFMLYQQYFSYLTSTVHKSMFPGLFLTSTEPVHYPDTCRPVLVLFPYPQHQGENPLLPVLKILFCHSRGWNPQPPAHKADALTTGPSWGSRANMNRCPYTKSKESCLWKQTYRERSLIVFR